MTQNATIRPAEENDLRCILALSKNLQTDTIPCSYWGLDETSVKQLIEALHKQTLVAHIDNTLAGIGTLSRGGSYQRHLAEISVAVSSNHRRLGIAGSLINHLERIASEMGIELIKALIWTKNTPSRALFKSLGYEHRTTLYAEFKSPEFGEIDDCVYYKRITEPAPSSLQKQNQDDNAFDK